MAVYVVFVRETRGSYAYGSVIFFCFCFLLPYFNSLFRWYFCSKFILGLLLHGDASPFTDINVYFSVCCVRVFVFGQHFARALSTWAHTKLVLTQLLCARFGFAWENCYFFLLSRAFFSCLLFHFFALPHFWRCCCCCSAAPLLICFVFIHLKWHQHDGNDERSAS